MHKERPFPSCWLLRNFQSREETAVAVYPATARFRAANLPGSRPCAAAFSRRQALTRIRRSSRARWRACRALERLREFRQKLYECLDARADALFELANAVLCADHAVTSLVQLSTGAGVHPRTRRLVRRARRRAHRRREAVLPADGGTAPARRRAGGDRVDRGARRDRPRPAGEGAGRSSRRPGGAGARRVRPLEPAAVRRRRDRLPPPGRVVLPGPRARAQRRLPLQGLVQDHAGLGVPVHRRCRAPAHRVGRARRRGPHHARYQDSADDRAGEERAAPDCALPGTGRRPRRCSSSTPATAPPPSPTASWAARPTSWSGSPPAACSTQNPSPGQGKYGRPPRRGAAVHCLEPADFAAAATGGSGPRGRKKPLPAEPRTGRGTHPAGHPALRHRTAEAWHDVHPLIHGDRGWFAGREKLPVLRGTLVHVTVERLPDGRDPHRAMWLWHAGPGPLSLDELWRAYLARFDIEHVFKFLKGHPRAHRREGKDPGAGRPLGDGSSRPPGPSSCSPATWPPTSAAPGKNAPIPPGRCRRDGPAAGFATSALTWAHPPVSRNPPPPGQAGPKAAAKAQLPATFSPAKPTCHAQQKRL